MKTLQDCKERLVRRKGLTWPDYICHYNGASVLIKTNQAAELYGRYMRFVGRAQMRAELRRDIMNIKGGFNYQAYKKLSIRDEHPDIFFGRRNKPQTDYPDELFLLTL